MGPGNKSRGYIGVCCTSEASLRGIWGAEMNLDEAHRAAAAAGLDRLTDADLALLTKSLDANRTLRQRLPADLHWSEEIAPVLRLADMGQRGKTPTGGTKS